MSAEAYGPAAYDARMERFRVRGGARLEGEVRVTGAKNSVLKLMAAALLARGRSTISEVPDNLDVEIMSELLRRLGCDVQRDLDAATVSIDVPEQPRAPGRLRPRPSDARQHLRPRAVAGADRRGRRRAARR